MTKNTQMYGRTQGRKQANLRRRILPVMIASCFSCGVAVANPVGPQVVNGQVNFSTQGNFLSITNSPGSVINWQNFSIASGDVTRFTQQSSSSSVLNRVIGQDPSQILGALQSNGHVFIINPNGILFGQGAQVDVNGLVASTLNLSDDDFHAGKMNFKAGATAGDISNQGAITTPSGGQIYLIASNVENSGIITSPKGDVVLAAGHTVQLVDSANSDVRVVVSAPESHALNLGQIIAQGGKIGIYGALINQRGIVSANSAVVGENGKIVFKASGDAVLDAGSKTTATGAGKGGDVSVLGDRVALFGDAQLDVSGMSGGGTALIGGDYQGKNQSVQNARQSYVSTDAQIKADAIQNGDGGKVIVWANDTTQVYGGISARGGAQSGNGGFIETSAHWLDATGKINAGAPKGKAGAWLLDPYDIVVGGPTDNGSFDVSGGWTATGGDGTTSHISALDLSNALTGSNVYISTNAGSDNATSAGNITFSGNSINWSAPNTLALDAVGNISIDAPISNGSGILGLRASGDILQSVPIQVSELYANAAGTVNLNINSNIFAKIAGHAGSGGFTAVSSTPFSVDTVSPAGLTSLSGIATANGPVSLSTTSGAMTINNMINSGGGAVTISSADNINFTSTGAISSGGGPVNLTANSAGAQIGMVPGSTINTAGNDIVLSADRMDLAGGPGSINAGSGEVSLAPTNVAETGLNLGAGATDGPGILGLDDTELKAITTSNSLYIGGTLTTANTDIVGALNLTGGGLTGELSIDSGTGDLNVNFPLTVPSTLVLTSGGAITQASNAVLSATALKAVGGTVTLLEANPVGVISGSASSESGDFQYRSSNGLMVSAAGIQSSLGSVKLVSDSTSGVSQSPTSPISANGLLVVSAGPVTLDSTLNNVSQIAADLTSGSGAFSMTNNGNLSVDAVLGTNGVTTNNQPISLNTKGGNMLSVSQPINAGTSNVLLTTDNLSLGNPVTALNVGITNDTETRPITIGSEGAGLYLLDLFWVTAPTIKIGSTTGNVSGPITVVNLSSTDRNALTTRIGLFTAGTVTQSGIIDVQDLAINAGGAVSLTSANNVTNLAGTTSSGNFTFNSAGALNVAALTGTGVSMTGIQTPAGNVALTAVTGDLTVGSLIDAGAGNVDLTATAGALTGGIVKGGIFHASATNGMTLSTQVGTLYAMNSGSNDINITNAGPLTLQNSSQSTGAGNITINNTGALTVAGTVTTVTGTGDINLVAHSPLTVASGGTVQTNFGAINLTAGSSGSTADKLIVASGGSVTSTNGIITLTAGDTIDTSAGNVSGNVHLLPSQNPPPAPPPPTLAACITDPSLAGCDKVLPTSAQCSADPSLAGCVKAPPTLAACIIDPSLSGCAAVLPTSAQCSANPGLAGCPPPTLAACIIDPSLSGCAAVLPTSAQCSANPGLTGCPPPTLAACIIDPSLSGCAAILPTTAQCAANPSVAGCPPLPSLAACTVTPSLAGCDHVLPKFTDCVATPSLLGCGAVLPTVAQCLGTPTVAGCNAVLPPVSSTSGTNEPVAQAINSTINIINTSTTPVVTVRPTDNSGDKKTTDVGKDDAKNDDKKETVVAKDTVEKKDEPAKKMYCN